MTRGGVSGVRDALVAGVPTSVCCRESLRRDGGRGVGRDSAAPAVPLKQVHKNERTTFYLYCILNSNIGRT